LMDTALAVRKTLFVASYTSQHLVFMRDMLYDSLNRHAPQNYGECISSYTVTCDMTNNHQLSLALKKITAEVSITFMNGDSYYYLMNMQ